MIKHKKFTCILKMKKVFCFHDKRYIHHYIDMSMHEMQDKQIQRSDR